MSFIAKNPLIAPEVESSPPVPITGTRGVYASRDGWYDIDSNGVVKKISTDALSYKGSVKNTSSLPLNPSTGDVYNIEEESTIKINGESKTLHLIPVYGAVYEMKDFQGTYDSSYDYWWEFGEKIELFDSNGKSLGIANCMTLTGGIIYTFPTDFLELDTDVAYAQLPGKQDGNTAPGNEVLTYEKVEITIAPNQKVFYNGSSWDVFLKAGSGGSGEYVDLSDYAKKATTLAGYGIEDAYTKDEVGIIQTNLERRVDEVDAKVSSVYRYKGNVKTTADLPTSNLSVGDVWNVETAGVIGEVLKLIPLTSVGFDSADAWNGYYDAALYPVLLSEEKGNPIDLYDENYNKVGSNVYANYTASTQCLFIFPFDIQPGYENAKYFQLSGGSAYGETIVLGSLVEAGDNVAWTGTEWDVLAGTVDLSGYATKEDVNIRLSSVYKYKGTVEKFVDLPQNAEIGDVYNIANEYSVSKYVKPVTIVDSYLDGDYSYAYVNSGNGTDMPPWVFNAPIANVLNANLNKVTEAGWNDISVLECQTGIQLEIGKTYYLEYFGVSEADLSYERGMINCEFSVNAGDNVAWTGVEWDVLAGTVDTSAFAIKSDTLSGYGIVDAYTKNEVNAKLASVYRYKGTVENIEELPTTNEIGDVYNVEQSGSNEKELFVIPLTSIEIDSAGACVGYYNQSKYPVYNGESGGMTSIIVSLYDKNLNTIASNISIMLYEGAFLAVPPQDIYLEAKYFQLASGGTVGETIHTGFSIQAGDNVAWTNDGWDVLAATVDFSNYMSKDDIIPSTQVNHGEDSLSDIIDTYVLNQDTPMATIGLDTTVPEGSLPSICDFELKPTTPLCIYDLANKKVLGNGEFNGDEIPFLTTQGDLIVTDENSEIKIKKHIDSLININRNGWNVSDKFTQDGVYKAWSKKFYLTKEEYASKENIDYTNAYNTRYVFEFDESDFAETGIPAKLDDIPVATPCFYTGNDAQAYLNGRVWGGQPFPLKFSYNKETGKYTMTIRSFGKDLFLYQMKLYTKTYIYYQLETPYVENDFLAMGLEEGDKVSFEIDNSYIQTYLDASSFFKKGADGDNVITEADTDTTPTFTAFVPQNTKDALVGFSNAAKIFNEGQTSTGSVAQDYSWIGDGDGTTDYTSKIQNKINELSSISNGGTIFLGNGTYNVSNFIEIYDNIKLIGTGNTVIKQTNKNSHVLIISGSNIAIKDLTISLYRMTAEEKSDIANYNTEITACVYINSNNLPGKTYYCSDYKENLYCQDFTMDNVYLSGSYGFDYSSGTAAMSNDYEHYRGCGLLQRSLYFNYATITNTHINGMYCGLHGVGGSNDITVFCEGTKIMVYANGGYGNINIYGHSYYATDNSGKTISMSDVIAHCSYLEQSYIAEYVYDVQWMKNIFVFDGYTINNRYLVSQIAGGSYFSNDNEGTTIKLEDMVVDYGRGNRPIENFQNTPFHIGARFVEKTGMSSYKANDSITQNALSGAGVWGNITSNDGFGQGVLTLPEVCRYPQETDVNRNKDGSYIMSMISNNSPSEENPIEIIIDVSDRPIYSFPGCFIQFDSRYVASDFSISFDIDNTNNFSHEFKVVGNTDVVWSWMFHQKVFMPIYKLKIVITKALYLESLKYQDSGYNKYEKEYNPNKKVGICNIGMVDSDFTGRAFIGECGGKVYGDLLLNQNSTIKNVPAPVDSGDAVPKEYIDGIVGDIKTALDYIKELQNSYIGGDGV